MVDWWPWWPPHQAELIPQQQQRIPVSQGNWFWALNFTDYLKGTKALRFTGSLCLLVLVAHKGFLKSFHLFSCPTAINVFTERSIAGLPVFG
jgi:hypothetical protein